MSTLGYRNEVRFSEYSDNMMNSMAANTHRREFSSTLSVSTRQSSEGETPRSILKDRDSVEQWLERRSCTSLPSLHEWTAWRTRLNDAMIDLIEERHRIFSYPGSVRHLQKHQKVMRNLVEPDFLIGQRASELALARAVHDHVTGSDGFRLQAPAFISFGLPRVRLRSNSLYDSDEHGAGSVSSGTLTGSESPKARSENSSIVKPVLESSTENESVHGDSVAFQRNRFRASVRGGEDRAQGHVRSNPQPLTPNIPPASADTESICAVLDIREETESSFGI